MDLLDAVSGPSTAEKHERSKEKNDRECDVDNKGRAKSKSYLFLSQLPGGFT